MKKRVAISAGAGGIGRVIAEAFLEGGADVYVCDVDESAVTEFKGRNPYATAVTADAGNPNDVDQFFDHIAADGRGLDVLVNNAGIAGPTSPLEDISVEDWTNTINVDLNSAFYFSRRAIPMLRAAGGGSIINIASNASFFGFPFRSPYTASKWAIIGLTKTLAMELGADNIRVNAICPGSVEGQRIDRVIEKDAAARGMSLADVECEYKRQSSLRTFVKAADIAAMAQFLTSEAGRRISGQAIGLDGHTEGLSLNVGK
ncbi:MAG: SDR family oxidoreductase [Pseudomonadota bacterium]